MLTQPAKNAEAAVDMMKRTTQVDVHPRAGETRRMISMLLTVTAKMGKATVR